MSSKIHNKGNTIDSTRQFLDFTIWKANLLSKGIHQSYVVSFVSNIIWRVSHENVKNSPNNKPQKRTAFLYWFERAIDLFTKKDRVWQIDNTFGLVTYEESVKRIIIFALTLTTTSLLTCTLLTITIEKLLIKETIDLSLGNGNHTLICLFRISLTINFLYALQTADLTQGVYLLYSDGTVIEYSLKQDFSLQKEHQTRITYDNCGYVAFVDQVGCLQIGLASEKINSYGNLKTLTLPNDFEYDKPDPNTISIVVGKYIWILGGGHGQCAKGRFIVGIKSFCISRI